METTNRPWHELTNEELRAEVEDMPKLDYSFHGSCALDKLFPPRRDQVAPPDLVTPEERESRRQLCREELAEFFERNPRYLEDPEALAELALAIDELPRKRRRRTRAEHEARKQSAA